MRRLAGQAGRLAALAAHHTFVFLISVLIAILLALVALAWRLDRGPIDVPFIANGLSAALSGRALSIHVSHAALAWEGFSKGGTAPLDLRLAGLSARTGSGATLADAAAAHLVFKAGSLFGSGAPIEIAAGGASIEGGSVPVSLRAELRLGLGLRFDAANVALTLGAGTLAAGGAHIPITGGHALLSLTEDRAQLQSARIATARIGQSAPVLTATGSAWLTDMWHARLDVRADAVHADDLASFWPPALGANARAWVTKNVTGGLAANGALHLGLTAPRDLSALTLTGGTGGFDATGLTLAWLKGEAPIEDLSGHLALTDLDDIAIRTTGGHAGGLALGPGSMTISDLNAEDTPATITVPVSGTVPAALAIIGAKPLDLLASLPAAFRQSPGTLDGTIAVSLPLHLRVRLAQVALHVHATLADLAFPLPGSGLSLDKAGGTLDVTQNGLTFDGGAALAGAPATLGIKAGFTRPPSLALDGHFAITPALLARLGAGSAFKFTGSAPAALTATADKFSLHADLAPATIAAPAPLAWSKPRGAEGALDVSGLLGKGATPVIEAVSLAGPGLAFAGRRAGGGYAIDRLVLGRTNARGTILPPAATGGPWRADLSGTALDLAPFLPTRRPDAAAPAATAPAAAPAPAPAQAGAPAGPLSGTPWQAHLAFATLYLAPAPAPAAAAAEITATGAGGRVDAAQAGFTLKGGAPVRIALAQAGAQSRLDLTTPDAGTFLRTIDAIKTIQGGALNLSATVSGGRTEGVARMDKFRIDRAPGAAKLLQGISVYGLPAAASGPGLAFDKLVVPFAKNGPVITLKDCRAFSPTLGFTAEGTVDLAKGLYDISGTIVPAYAINALPGKIPLIGKLFSPEKGGGLFALRYTYTGPADAPKVSVNPLSALTPGFLRGIFGMFKQPAK